MGYAISRVSQSGYKALLNQNTTSDPNSILLADDILSDLNTTVMARRIR